MPGPFVSLHRGSHVYDTSDPYPLGVLNGHSCSLLMDENGCRIGVIARTRSRSWLSTHRSSEGALVVLYGHCCDPQYGAQLDACSLQRALQADGENLWNRVEGAFNVVLYEPARNRLQLINDRLSILPIYWYRDDDLFCFAPALRFLPRHLQRGVADATSVVHFLSIGKYPGTHTLLSDISLLGPATRLTVDLRTLEIDSHHYWELEYHTEPTTTAKALVIDLGDAIERATDLLTRPECGSGGLFLSGGWDSRSLLGASLALNRPPTRVITNGVSDEIPDSDTWLAKRLAHDFRLPYYFSRRKAEAGEDAWLEGLWLCEAATENSPGNFGIQRLPDDQFTGLDFMLKGDVTWGSGDLTETPEGVINKNFPNPLAHNVLSVLAPSLRPDAQALYLDAIEAELLRCPNDHPADRQQWLWQMSGINRYIFGLGYFDEEFVQIRRPLVTRMVLDQWCRVPWRLRIHKNLFLEHIHRRYPRLFAYGRNHTSHLADYYVHMASFIRERTIASLHAGCDLDGLLDREECLRRVETFRPDPSAPAFSSRKTRIRNRLHDRHAWRYHRTRWYRENPASELGTSNVSLVFRLYLLIEWYHHQRQRIPAPRG